MSILKKYLEICMLRSQNQSITPEAPPAPIIRAPSLPILLCETNSLYTTFVTDRRLHEFFEDVKHDLLRIVEMSEDLTS
jgi:hypothetical protein